MKKILILFILALIVLPLVSSQVYERETIVNLKIPFEVNGAAASSSADCNLSVYYPDSTILFENESMTNNNNGIFNKTLLETDTKQLGEYDWVMFCCDGTLCAAGYDTIKITPSGEDDLTTAQGINLLIAIGIMLGLGLLFFIYSFKIDFKPMRIFFMGFAIILFLAGTIFTMVSLTQVLGGYDSIINVFSSFYWMFIFIVLVITIILLLLLFKNVLDLMMEQKGLR